MLGDVRLDQTRFWEIDPQLRTLRARLNEYQDLIRTSPAAARALGKDLIAAENAYGDAVAKYQRLLVLFGMDPAVGLSAFPPLLVPAAVVATIVAIFASIGLVWHYINASLAPKAKAEQLRAETEASLQQRGAAAHRRKQEAYQRGDTAAAQREEAEEARILAEMQATAASGPPPKPEGGVFAWIEHNWPFAVMGSALILLSLRK